MSAVYFIQAGEHGPVKIGVAANAAARVASLQTGSPVELRLLATVPGDTKTERRYHRELAADRVRGEWFNPSPSVMRLVGQPLPEIVGPRSHSDIVKAAGSDAEVAIARGVSNHTVRSWIQRDSIPPEHWAGFAGTDAALLSELAEYAAAKPRKPRIIATESAAA